MSIAREHLNAARTPTCPVLALERAEDHIFFTRDKTLIDADGYAERYTCKSDYDHSRSLGDTFRIKLPKLRTRLIVAIVEYQSIFHLNPIAMEGCPQPSSLITFGCPQRVDSFTRELYERQIKTLNEIVAADLENKPGVVDFNWVKRGSDGRDTIEIVCSYPAHFLYLDLGLGQDYEVVMFMDFYIKDAKTGLLYQMATLSIACRGLQSERDAHKPLFGADVLDQHYSLTRDGSLVDIAGPYSRYSYKALIPQGSDNRRTRECLHKCPRYRGLLIVEIDNFHVSYHDNPLERERNGRKCTSITTRCPTESDEDTVRLFDMQVARLQTIIDEDVREMPGRVASSWLKKSEDGSSMIEMTRIQMYGSPSELSVRMDMVPGTNLEVSVSLCKDERMDETGSRVKVLIFIELLQLHGFLTFRGRHFHCGFAIGVDFQQRKSGESKIYQVSLR
ncbi:hypothetical protein R3P38DRAFT_2782419 [Favolaschia claudopus]|uniref:Uncharacterized protein n=1 Tax=Favolaschia claudopus TaxID=2862362 RepID=A0AAW0B547_9AGAR